ncbi:hypothetical protein FALCPG4_001829 [Fusarium falciforme]
MVPTSREPWNGEWNSKPRHPTGAVGQGHGAFHRCPSHLIEQLFKPIDLLLGALVRSRASPFGPQQVAVILHEREDQETFLSLLLAAQQMLTVNCPTAIVARGQCQTRVLPPSGPEPRPRRQGPGSYRRATRLDLKPSQSH